MSSDAAFDLDMPAAAAHNGGLQVVNGNGHASSSSPAPPGHIGGGGGGGSHISMVNRPTFLDSPYGRFVIMDAPNDSNVASYIEVLKRKQVVVLARVCDPTYSAGPMLANGIKMLEIPFPDGDPPPQHVVDKWLRLVDQVFKHGGQPQKGGPGHTSVVIDLDLAGVAKPAIAIHCVAGLGRAPVMVAIALVENGMEVS